MLNSKVNTDMFVITASSSPADAPKALKGSENFYAGEAVSDSYVTVTVTLKSTYVATIASITFDAVKVSEVNYRVEANGKVLSLAFKYLI